MALERAFGKPVIQLREEFREDFREQMTTERLDRPIYQVSL